MNERVRFANKKRADKICSFTFCPEIGFSKKCLCYNSGMIINAGPVIKKLEELRNKRNCQCSAQKVLERAYFDIVIADVRMMEQDGMLDADKAVSDLERIRLSARASRREQQIKYNVYEYAIRVIRKCEQEEKNHG